MLQKSGVTLIDVHAKHNADKSPASTYQLANTKGFPDHEFKIGKTRVFDPRKVDRYFADRAKRKRDAARKAKRG